ncbi:MAG: hypothetical protein SOW46_07860, partial [Candidatus Aphodomonas sp.]|nr:hypothetical protein [Candidatus Aphodomonas sp.]
GWEIGSDKGFSGIQTPPLEKSISNGGKNYKKFAANTERTAGFSAFLPACSLREKAITFPPVLP